MRFKVFYEVPTESAVAVAEHVISRLASAYCTMGGFNGHQAGISVASSETIPASVYRKILGRLEPNMEYNLRLTKAHYDSLKKKRTLVDTSQQK